MNASYFARHCRCRSLSRRSPPTSGSLAVLPAEGYSLDTVFSLSSLNWVDSDLPLSYEFKFDSGAEGDMQVPLMMAGSSTQIDTMLPPGDFLTLRVVVTDSLGAASTSKASAVVLMKDSSVDEVMENMHKNVEESERMMDGESISGAIDSSVKLSGNVTLKPEDSTFMMQKLRYAFGVMGGGSSAVERVAGTLSSVAAVSEDVETAEMGLSLITTLVAAESTGDKLNTVKLIVTGLSNIIGRISGKNMSIVDGVLSDMARGLIEGYAPGIGDVVTTTENVVMFSNVFEFVEGGGEEARSRDIDVRADTCVCTEPY